MNEFVPRGYLPLKEALEYFGRLKHADKWEAEKASSKQEFQQLLFAADLVAEVLTDDGNLHSLRSSIWGSVEAARISETGRASISVGDEYFPDTVHVPVLIKQSSIDALFNGDSDEVETGAEDPPAQALPPHDEPDPQEPAETPVPEGSDDESGPPRKKPAELMHKRWITRAKELKEFNPDISTSAIAQKIRTEDQRFNEQIMKSNDPDKTSDQIRKVKDTGTIRRILTERQRKWNLPSIS